MLLDQSLCRSQLPIVHAVILRQLDFRLKPELRLAVGAKDMNVASRLFPREEVEPELPFFQFSD